MLIQDIRLIMFRLSLIYVLTLFLPIHQENCVDKFNGELGLKQAKVLDLIVDRMDEVIKRQNASSYADQHRMLLKQIAFGPDRKQRYNVADRLEIYDQIKSSGLDSAIWEMSYRERNGKAVIVRNIDVYSRFFNGLKASYNCDSDSLIQEYVNSIELAGSISPSLIASGVVERFKDKHFNHPIVKRILVVEIYIHYFLYPQE